METKIRFLLLQKVRSTVGNPLLSERDGNFGHVFFTDPVFNHKVGNPLLSERDGNNGGNIFTEKAFANSRKPTTL